MSSNVNGKDYTPRSKTHPRRSAEAQAYALRVRDGTGNLFGSSNGHTGDTSPMGKGARLPTAEAKRNYDLNKGCMTEVMAGIKNCENHSLSGNQNESFRTAESNKGEAMRTLMDKYGEMNIMERPVPKLKGEDAQHYADRNHGSLDMLFHNYGNIENIPDVVPRYGHSGEENAKKNHGTEMGTLLRMEGEKEVADVKYSRLHQQSNNASWDEIPPSSRLRPDGELIVARYNNGAMKEIMGQNMNSNHKGSQQNYFKPSSNSYKRQSHHLERNGNFLNGYTSGSATTPSRGHVSPTRTKPEAVEYHNKNKHSEVGAIIRGEPLPVSPNRRTTNRNLIRSEEW
ncbi:uncharacterized protein LOC115216716 isoform X2 [Argonauta hians]